MTENKDTRDGEFDWLLFVFSDDQRQQLHHFLIQQSIGHGKLNMFLIQMPPLLRRTVIQHGDTHILWMLGIHREEERHDRRVKVF